MSAVSPFSSLALMRSLCVASRVRVGLRALDAAEAGVDEVMVGGEDAGDAQDAAVGGSRFHARRPVLAQATNSWASLPAVWRGPLASPASQACWPARSSSIARQNRPHGKKGKIPGGRTGEGGKEGETAFFFRQYFGSYFLLAFALERSITLVV